MSQSPTSDPAATAARDHWEVLGLAPGADAAGIKRAFRQQARRWHPDLNDNDPVAEARFKEVNEAYAVLSDPARRRAWEAGEGQDSAGLDADPFATGFPRFEDYLAELFGQERRSPRDWEEEPVEEDPPAAGEVATAPAAPPPVMATTDEETLVTLAPEQALSGQRLELELRDGTVVEVWTPPLAGDGWRLRLAGVAPGGADHFLQLRVRTAEGLRIDGLRVHYQLDLHPADAALGCQAVVPTLEGPVRLRVPAGSSSGRLLRLRQRGQRLGEQRGDQLVEVRIVVPERPTEAEEALFRRLRELDREQNGPRDGD
ncbi:DnaJ domain-containing protein [Cyanobium gracile]|uniref:DnaJ-class molecular chaperone with C-terminal Zn finger domain n=1 Tax=Cyanobium gracile (strain ATCC 27147 / PCC 6307) TaxID=292564 RepID=K9P5F5_CYAGP|nr:DnaJ domain-containing protein [Cyanobium gracile]AFY27794.1 DnaJ-class molecular chaperone with C-terminal Zn finger domain [Cyanobium gracile PCC 6307]